MIIIGVMKKAKDIITTANLTRLVMALAVLLSLIAVFLVVTRRAPVRSHINNECKTVVVVSNLPPRKLRGIESQGMLLCAVDEKTDTLSLISTDKTMPSGCEVC
jgi:tRNA-binding EMAP/Myf-like protein